MTDNVYGIVVVFNPDVDVVENIRSYCNCLDELLIYDNSSSCNLQVFKELLSDKIKYIYNGCNDGISIALNYALNRYNDGWLLTMDQDSSFIESEFSVFKSKLIEIPYNTGILSPKHTSGILDSSSICGFSVSDIVMTSGNLVNIEIAKKVSGYDEDYFIDCVDWDFCIKLNANGYSVMIDNSIILNHGLGDDPVIHKFLNFNVIVCNYSPFRRYYITRNKLRFFRAYKALFKRKNYSILLSLFYDLFKIVFFEKGKVSKLKAFVKGILDYFRGNFGKVV
jgi:rhamnosyltransferase